MEEGSFVQFDKEQIIDFLAVRGRHGEVRLAARQLPSQVDTDRPEHRELLEQIGVSPTELAGNLTGGTFGL